MIVRMAIGEQGLKEVPPQNQNQRSREGNMGLPGGCREEKELGWQGTAAGEKIGRGREKLNGGVGVGADRGKVCVICI